MKAEKDDDGRRLDRIIRRAFPAMPVSAIYRILRKGGFRVNGIPCEGAVKLRAGDVIQFDAKDDLYPEVISSASRLDSELISGNTALPPLEVLFENDDLIAVNKPSGLVTHGHNSLESLVKRYLSPILPFSLSFRSGPLHRLDRETSGLLFFSKSLAGASYFSAALRDGLLRKSYLVLLRGELCHAAVWQDYIRRDSNKKKSYICKPDKTGAKFAGTHIIPLYPHRKATFAIAEIATGRTHQIRACAAAHGYPLYGDAKYGSGDGRFFLHAHSLGFPLDNPLSLPELVTAPPSSEFISAISKIVS